MAPEKNSIIESTQDQQNVWKMYKLDNAIFVMFIKIGKICLELALFIYGQLEENNHTILMLRSTQHMPCSSVFIDLVT